MKTINIKRPFYTMATKEGNTAEILMYGNIVVKQPKDFWTGKPIEGNYIIGDEFLKDLKQIEGCSEITIRLNSEGGDAGVSILIHNRLRELASKGAKLICIVDGVAMSGGSLIMCACDTVKVNASSLIMIHKCWSLLLGPYNADELRNLAKSNDAYDEAQSSIYTRKTGLSKTQILHMMADTTYMNGTEAKEKGFADEVLEEEPIQIAASADRRTLYVGQREMRLMPGVMLPESIPTVDAGAVPVETNTNEPKKGGSTMANTIEELRKENPELVAQLVSAERAAERADAIQAEQKRLQEIDDLAGLFSADLVREAKYGKKACSAQELSYRAAVDAAKNGKQFLAKMTADAKESNTDAVPAAPAHDPEPKAAEPKTEQEKEEAAKAAVKEIFHKGGK